MAVKLAVMIRSHGKGGTEDVLAQGRTTSLFCWRAASTSSELLGPHSLHQQLACMQTDLELEEDPATAPLRLLTAKHLDTSPAALCGPPHKVAHPNRCFFIDSTLWTAPALAPTAVVPTLPETSAGECGFRQLELGDEEQLARYPVLQALRSGISLDSESYTRGSYHTVPVVPGAGFQVP